MSWIFVFALLAFALQSAIIAIDEFFCHRRRLLPRWELVGHPVDIFCLCLYFLSLAVFRTPLLPVLLGVISCLVITKDEWVHKDLSSGFENWLHALLFVLHPAVVISYFVLWRIGSTQGEKLLQVSLACVGGYFLYQCWMGWRRWQKV